jgi:hypothetical protein
MQRPLVAALWIGALLARPVPAHAADFTLSWDAPAGCPSEASVRDEVARWLDSSARADDEPTIVASAEVTRTAAGYELELRVATPSGSARKRMASRRCETFAEVIALELSLAASPPGTPAEESADGGREPPSGSGLVFGARALVGGGSGPTPGFAPTLGIAATLRCSPLRFELGASYGPAIRARYAMPDEVGADFELFAGSGRACYALANAPAELPLCLGGEFGVLRASAFGVAGAVSAGRDWAALQLVQGLRWPSSGPISGWLEGSAAVALLRPAFRVRNLEQLHRVAPLVFRAAVGIELQID